MSDEARTKEVIIIFHNHVDPEWARCFEEYAYNGNFITRSYADVFEWMVDSFIALSGHGFHYSEGQVVFWENYLKRNPEKEETLRSLVDKGQLEFLLQGYLTTDTNYIPAEGIIRNFLLARPFYSKYGQAYPVDQAFVWDAFGSSANLVQILKQFGASRVGGTKYRPCVGAYWVGIDGSKLPCIDERLGSCNLERGPILYVCARHPHCPVCGGYGCEACGGRGMVNRFPFRKEEIKAVLESCAGMRDKQRFVLIGGEEVIPDMSLIDAIRETQEKYGGKIAFRFGTLREFWESFQKDYQAVEQDYQEPGKDLNPVNQGGYLTRIENKQRVRKITYALLQGEAAYAAKYFKTGEIPPVPEDMGLAWRYLLMNMHHDSISGAHIDSGQRELMGWLDESERITAQYYVPAMKFHFKAGCLGADRKLLQKGKVYHKRIGELEVSFDEKGVISVRTNGQDVFGTYRNQLGSPRSHEEPVHIGELTLQDDVGDLYGTYLFGEPICLGQYHYCVMEEEEAIIFRGARNAGDTAAPKLEWETRIEASADGKRLDFTVRLDTEMTNKRVSVMIPVNDTASTEAVWEIPYGFIKRRHLTEEEAEKEIEDYYAPSQYERTAILPTGDYPALHWVRHAIDEKSGVALFNKGLPCNRYVPGCLILGLLRTPQMQGVTVIPQADEMWDISGAKSAGEHIFEFSVYPYTEPVTNGELTKLGYEYNDAILPLPFQIEGNAIATAFKIAEDGGAFILRLFETEGTDSKIKLRLHEKHFISAVMADEETKVSEATEGTVFEYTLHKHEILTLRIR